MESVSPATRICPQCGNALPPDAFRDGRRKCKRCEWAMPRSGNGETRSCNTCGVAVYRPRTRLNPDGTAFCSRRCSGLWRKGKATTQPAWNRGKTSRQSRTCATCGESFLIWPSQASSKSPRRYCSLRCRPSRRPGFTITPEQKRKQSIKMKGRPSWRPRVPPVTKMCEQCGGPFDVPRKRALEAKFCGRSCLYAWRRAHPWFTRNYRGGRIKKYGPDWSVIAEKVRLRDGYTCRDCGTRQRRPKLDVHHLIPLRSFGGDYETANHLDNLISVCKRCHKIREVQLQAARSA